MINDLHFQTFGFQGSPTTLRFCFLENKILWRKGVGKNEITPLNCDQIKVRKIYPVFPFAMIISSFLFLATSLIYTMSNTGLPLFSDIATFIFNDKEIAWDWKLVLLYMSFSISYFFWSLRLVDMNKKRVSIRFISHPPRKTTAHVRSPIFVCYSNFEGVTSDKFVSQLEEWAKRNDVDFIDSRKTSPSPPTATTK